MTAKTTKEVLLMQAVWRKALQDGEVVINLPAESDAKRLRFALYNAVRGIRKGELKDEELERAVQECAIQMDGATVTVQTKTRSAAMQAVLTALGGEVVLGQAPKTTEEAEIEESQRRLLERLQQTPVEVPPPQRVTPYYTREEG